MAGFKNWEKWTMMLLIVVGLSSIVVYFNVRVFGWWDGAPYIVVMASVVILSLFITRHLKHDAATTNFKIAAYIFEGVLIVAMVVSVAYSLSVMRVMSVAGQEEDHQTELAKTQAQSLTAIGRFKSPQAQRVATGTLAASRPQGKGTSPSLTKMEVFSQYERILRWIMIGELGFTLFAFFVLLGLSVFDKDGDGIPDFMQKTPMTRQVGMAPQMSSGMIAARNRAMGRRPMPGAHSHDIDDDDDEEGDDSPK